MNEPETPPKSPIGRLLKRSLPVAGLLCLGVLAARAQTPAAGSEDPLSALTDPTKDTATADPVVEVRRATSVTALDEPGSSGMLLPEAPVIPGAPPLPPPPSLIQRSGPVGTGTMSLSEDLTPMDSTGALQAQGTTTGLDAQAPSIASPDPWVFRLEGQVVYDNNVYLSRSSRQADTIFVLTPSVTFQHGDVARRQEDFTRLRYAVAGIVFAKLGGENSVDHDFELGTQKRFGKLALSGDARFRRLSGATPDIGDRAQRNEFTARVGASYQISDRTFLEASVRYNGARYQSGALADYNEWLADTFAGYQFSGRTRLSGGVAAGQTLVSGYESQNFQRVLAKAETELTGNLTLKGTAGVEFRQAARGNETTPVFAVTADYDAGDGTTVSAEGFRENLASGSLGGENMTRTGGALRVRQQFGTRFSAAVDAGYEQLDYQNVSRPDNAAAARKDDYLYVRPSLRYEFGEGGRAEVYYHYREDESSLTDFSFDGSQMGLSLGFDF